MHRHYPDRRREVVHVKPWLVVTAILVFTLSAVLFLRYMHNTGSVTSTGGHSIARADTAPASNTFDRRQYSLNDPTSDWVIVNKQRPLSPRTYAPPDLVTVGNGQYMRAAAAEALDNMVTSAKSAGYAITPESGYRSHETQVSVYNNEVRAFGQAVADSESARPGYSEHQTGLAIDLGSSGCNIADCFVNTPGGRWIAVNAYKFGFVLRYPLGKTNVTGYRYEAWHYRYVGVALSEEMHKDGITTLEEFFSLSDAPSY